MTKFSQVLPQNRYMIVDVVRGIAILLMIVYHFSWDLTFFGLADFNIFGNPYWIWFAKTIAGLILFVMGVAQVMAHRKGINSVIFLKRIGVILVCALVVSIGTYQIDPNSYIFFGILHFIALASILLVVVHKVPGILLIGLSILFLTGSSFLSHSVFSDPWMAWLGLWPISRASVDYIPVFPWLAIPLLGMVIGRWLLDQDNHVQLLKWQSTSPFFRLTYFAGRHSLLIYMAHQPILFGSLYAIMSITGN